MIIRMKFELRRLTNIIYTLEQKNIDRKNLRRYKNFDRFREERENFNCNKL